MESRVTLLRFTTCKPTKQTPPNKPVKQPALYGRRNVRSCSGVGAMICNVNNAKGRLERKIKVEAPTETAEYCFKANWQTNTCRTAEFI